MRTNKNLAMESLERREVFSVLPGVEGLALYGDIDTSPPPMEPVDFFTSPDSAVNQYTSGDIALQRGVVPRVSQATDQEIIDALNNRTQLTSTDSGIERWDATSVDAVFAESGITNELGRVGVIEIIQLRQTEATKLQGPEHFDRGYLGPYGYADELTGNYQHRDINSADSLDAANVDHRDPQWYVENDETHWVGHDRAGFVEQKNMFGQGINIGMASDSPDVTVSQVTDKEIIDALNNGTQVTVPFGTISGNVQRVDADSVDAVFAESGVPKRFGAGPREALLSAEIVLVGT